MAFNRPIPLFVPALTQQQLSHGQLVPQQYVTQRAPLGSLLPAFPSSELYREPGYYNSYHQEGPGQYPLNMVSPTPFPVKFQPEYKPYPYTPTSQTLIPGTVHYNPGQPSLSPGNMYPYPSPSSSSRYSPITAQTGTETFTQGGKMPSAFQSNQPASPSPASCSYAENQLSSLPIYLQNQSAPSYNKDHRSSLGAPQEPYWSMAAKELFFVKASQYGIKVLEKQTECKKIKVEPAQINDHVKEENANLFKVKVSQNGIHIESPQKIRVDRSTEMKTLDLLQIVKEKKDKDYDPHCSFLADGQEKTNAVTVEKIQWYNNHKENLSLSNEIDVNGDSMAKKAGSIYSASWSAEKMSSSSDTGNSSFTEQGSMSPTQLWMMDGKHEDISRDSSLEGIEQTVLDALNLQEDAWETEDDEALCWEEGMAQKEEVEGEEECQNIGVDLEEEERLNEAVRRIVETVITGALKELKDEGYFSKEEETKDYWSEIIIEGKEISVTEEPSLTKEITVDSVIHTGVDPGSMSVNGSTEMGKDNLKEKLVLRKQPHNKEYNDAEMNSDAIIKSTDVDIKDHTVIWSAEVDEEFESNCSTPPFSFKLNPESPEFKPGCKKVGDYWKNAINIDAHEEFRDSLNAMTEEETVPEKYVYSEIQPEIESESFLENSQVVVDRLVNFKAPGLGIQTETCLNVGQEYEKTSATHKIALKFNTDCPEFKPESQKMEDGKKSSTIRPDAPEFTPSLKTFILPSWEDVTYRIKPKAKVLHLVTPTVVEKFKSVDIQASVEVKEASSLTRRVKTKDIGTCTGSCDCRDVCVNTLESLASENSKFYVPKDIMPHPTKSVSCGMEPQSTESIGINADLGSPKEMELIEKLKQAQMELIRCRADLHVLQLQQTISNLKKEKKNLMEIFIGGEDKALIDHVIDQRILKSKSEILNIEESVQSWVEQIQMGLILDSVPALLFQSETQGPIHAACDSYQPVHMSPFKVSVSPVRGGFGAINIDSYRMDTTNVRVMASSKGPSSVDLIRTPIKRKMHENTDVREIGPVFDESLKPHSSSVDSVQVMHSMGPNGQFSPVKKVSPRHRCRECNAQTSSPCMNTSQQIEAEPQVQDSQTTNTLPSKDWSYLQENIEDTGKAEKVNKSESVVQKAEHIDELKKESKVHGKDDVKMQEADVEVKNGTLPSRHDMMLDREDSDDDVEGARKVDTKTDYQDRVREVGESQPDSEIIVNFNSPPPTLNEIGVMIEHGMSEGEISSSEKEIKKTTSFDMVRSDDTMRLAESLRKTEAVTDLQENKLSVCSSGLEFRKVGSLDHSLEKEQDTSSVKNCDSKVTLGSENGYVREINTNNNKDGTAVRSDIQGSALKLEMSDFSMVSTTEDVSSDKSQCEPISTKTALSDLIVNSSEDLLLSSITGGTIIVDNDVTTKDFSTSKGHCSDVIDTIDPAIISSSVSRYKKPLDDSFDVTDPAVISVSGSVSRNCFEISHARNNEPAAMDGIASQKLGSSSMEQQAAEANTIEPRTYSESFQTKTESEVGFNQEVGNTTVKTIPSLVNFQAELNLANAGMTNPASGAGLSMSGMTNVSSGLSLNPAVIITAVKTLPRPVSPQATHNVAMPSLSSAFMPVFSVPQVQSDLFGMPSAPQRRATSPPTTEMVGASQKGIPDPAGGMMGVDPILYQTVLAQIMKAYPDLSRNSEMLRSLALQQTTLLQFYICGGGGNTNLAGALPHLGVPCQSGTTEPSRLCTEFEGKGMNMLAQSDSKGSTDIPKKPLAPPPGNLPTVFSTESSYSTSVSKGFDFTTAVESPFKPISGESSSITTSALSFSFANTADCFIATAKMDTTTKTETVSSSVHPKLSVTSKTDQVQSKEAQEQYAEENINGDVNTEKSTQARISSSTVCHKNELEVLHKNEKLLAPDVKSPKLSDSHFWSTQTKPSGSVQNLHGDSSSKKPSGHANIEYKFMPQPNLASYPVMPPRAAQPSMLQPKLASYSMMPLMAAQPQLILPQYVKPNLPSKMLPPLMMQPRVFHPHVMQPLLRQYQPQTPHSMTPQHSFLAGRQHGFPQSTLELPQNNSHQNVPTPADDHNNNVTQGTSNHIVTRETSICHRTPDSDKHIVTRETSVLHRTRDSDNHSVTRDKSVPHRTFDSDNYSVTRDTSVPHRTPNSDNHSVTRDTSVPHRTPDSDKHIVTKDTSVPHRTPDSDNHSVTRDTSVPHRTPDSDKHIVTKDTSVPHRTPDSDNHSVTRDTSVPHRTPDSDKHIVTKDTSVPHRTPDSDNHSVTRDTAVPHRTPDSDKHIVTKDTSVPHRTFDSDNHSVTRDTSVPHRTLDSNVPKTCDFLKTAKSASPVNTFISSFVSNQISKSAEKSNASGSCPITTISTVLFSSKPKLSSPFASVEAGQPDFLPSFVKTTQYTSTRKPTPPVSKTTAIPEPMKTLSWRGATGETRENWDDEVDEYPQPFILKHNVKREITSFNGFYSDTVKPKDSKGPVVAADVRHKNPETISANPWVSQPQGHQGIVTSNEKEERKEVKKTKQEESWTEVTKKKKKESSKHEPITFTMIKLGTVSQTKASNFEKLIRKLMECFPNLERSALIDVITMVRKSRGGSLSGMTMKDIVDKAGEVIMAKQPYLYKLSEQSVQQQQGMFHLPNSVPANSSSMAQKSQSPNLPPEDGENDEEDICVICHDGLSMEETKTLDCGHIFHFQCIKQWVLGRERTCPNCRSLALFPEEFPHLE